VTLEDWRKRLRADPRATLAELAQSLIESRAGEPGLEELFWRALADYGTPEELARAVVGRLRIGPAAPSAEAPELLDLDHEHRVRVHGQLRLAAAESLAGIVRDRAERERIEAHPALLPEVALERRGRLAEAAALYALEHDLLPSRSRTRPGTAAEPLARAALCYQLARALHRVGDEGARALAAMEGVLALVEEARGRAGEDEEAASLPLRLSYHAREWLGLRHYEGGRYRDAVRQFLRAAEAAPDTDLELAAGIFAANALIRDRRQAEARRLLDSLRERVSRVGSDLSEEWEAQLRKLTEAGPEEDDPG